MMSTLLRTTNRARATLATCLAVIGLVGVQSAAEAAGTCPPRCIAAVSVVGAPGIPDDVSKAIDGVRFQGTAVAADAITMLKQAAGSVRRGSTLKLTVAADAGLSGRAASTQVAARIKSLDATMRKAGWEAGQYTINAAP